MKCERSINVPDLTRVLVIGCPGSGKTTFALELAKKLNLELFHLDKELFRKNWQMVSEQEKVEIVNKLIGKDEWIIDGMWLSCLKQRLSRATAVVYLDYNRWTCFFGAYSRYKKYKNVQRFDHAEGCLDNFTKEFRRCILTYNKANKQKILQMLEEFGKEKVITFKTRNQAKRFLRQIETRGV